MNEDKATRYQRLKRRAGIVSLVWNVVLMAAIVVSGASVGLRTYAEAIAPAGALHDALTVALYVVFLALATDLAGLPLAFYSGYLLERRYGLSNEPLGGWAIDQLKSFAIFIVFGVIAAGVVYGFIRRSPEWWWVPAGAVFAVLVVGLAHLGPELLLPLFYRV